jgi:hypothetical protein
VNVRLTRLQGDAASFHPYAVPVDAGFHSYTNDVARACESCQAVVRAKTADAALKFICLAPCSLAGRCSKSPLARCAWMPHDNRTTSFDILARLYTNGILDELAFGFLQRGIHA